MGQTLRLKQPGTLNLKPGTPVKFSPVVEFHGVNLKHAT